jgi:hypothetical protein
VNRCVAFPVAVASDGSSIHEIRRDAGRPWPAGPAAEPPSTGATTVASIPRVDGLRGGSVDPNGRVHPIDDAGQESRGGGHYGRTAPTGAPRPSERRHASPTVWSTPARTSTISCPDAILARHNERSRRFEHLSLLRVSAPRASSARATDSRARHLIAGLNADGRGAYILTIHARGNRRQSA